MHIKVNLEATEKTCRAITTKKTSKLKQTNVQLNLEPSDDTTENDDGSWFVIGLEVHENT